MRTSAIALVLSLLGIVAGASLIGVWAVGCAVIFDSLCAGVWAVLRETGEGATASVAPSYEVPTLGQVLERARKSA